MDLSSSRPCLSALYQYESDVKKSKRRLNALFDESSGVFLQFNLFTFLERDIITPSPIQLPFSYFSPSQGHSICLFVADTNVEELREHFYRHPYPGLDSIISLRQVITEFQSFKKKG